MSAPESTYPAWVAKAENDFLNIRNNLQAASVPWDTICFHSQQAAEKLLKAVLVFHGLTPPRTHDLVALLTRCIEFDKGLATLEEDCRRLTAYAVGSRYPDDLFDPSKEEALEMAATAIRVRDRVLKSLPIQKS
jgi:HEPN domain-containing protein